MILTTILAALLIVVGSPDLALAWGPVTHLYHGASLLGEMSRLPAVLQPLLAEFRWEYLYGCIGADIVQFKRYTPSIYTHCHSWRVGWKVLETAATPAERAFAYGYLSHLVSDVYSHNFFVPGQMVASFPSRTRRHIYWESRFDAQLSSADRRLLARISAHRFPPCDALVERVVGRTLLSFRTNKRIFDSMVAVQRLERWQTMLRRVTSRSRYELPAEDVERFNRLCLEAIVDLLTNGDQAAALEHDPTGHESIRQARRVCRNLRELARKGVPIERLRRRFVAGFACGEPHEADPGHAHGRPSAAASGAARRVRAGHS